MRRLIWAAGIKNSIVAVGRRRVEHLAVNLPALYYSLPLYRLVITVMPVHTRAIHRCLREVRVLVLTTNRCGGGKHTDESPLAARMLAWRSIQQKTATERR